MSTRITLMRAAGVGFAAGIRTMTPVAAVSAAGAEQRLKLPKRGPLSLLRRREIALAVAIAAGSEWFIDVVLPLPPRTLAPSLLLRMSAGALAGAAVAAAENEALWPPACIGGLASLGGTFGGHRVRYLLTSVGVPDLAVALAEDLVSLSLSFSAVPRAKGAVA